MIDQRDLEASALTCEIVCGVFDDALPRRRAAEALGRGAAGLLVWRRAIEPAVLRSIS